MEILTEQLRQRNRKLRAQLSKHELELAAAAVCKRICALAGFKTAQHIAAYFAVNGEIGLAPVIDRALSQGKQIFLEPTSVFYASLNDSHRYEVAQRQRAVEAIQRWHNNQALIISLNRPRTTNCYALDNSINCSSYCLLNNIRLGTQSSVFYGSRCASIRSFLILL